MFRISVGLLAILLTFLVIIENASALCEQKKIATGHVRNIVDSRVKAWPWVTAIFNVTTRDYLFSGSLISREHVIIAAHNVLERGQRQSTSANELIVWLGKFNLDLYEEDTIGINPSSFIIHPDWKPDSNSFDHDIALLLLNIVVDLTPRIQPIALATFNYEKPITDEDGFVVGFNLTQTRTYKRDLKQASLLKVLECPCDDKDKIVANVSSSFEKITSGDGFFVREVDWNLGGILLSTNFKNHLETPCDTINTIFIKMAPYTDWIYAKVNETNFRFLTFKVHFETKTFLGNNLDYRAVAEDWEVLTPRYQMQGVDGIHESPKTNDHVQVLEIKNQTTLFYMPKNMGRIFRNITNLSANFNGLKLVKREAFFFMVKVKLLWLQDNQIEELVAENFTPLLQLEYLRLSRNKIKKINENAFNEVKTLKKLRLNQNLIENLPEKVFEDLINLEFLELSGNKIKSFPAKLFQNLKKLDELRAENNNLKTIYVNFVPMISLKQIDLDKNECIDDTYGFGSFNWILFGSKKYLTSLQNDIIAKCQ